MDRMKLFFFFSVLLLDNNVSSQPTVKVELSADTISVGEIVSITYTIENGDGELSIPDMEGLPVISGPNTSSSFTYQNGKMSSNQSYSFRLRPMDKGRLLIPQTQYQSKETVITIHPVEIVVLEEPSKPSSSKIIQGAPSGTITREKRKF